MKATELLRAQHRDVDELIRRLEATEGREREPLVERLASSLVAHSAIETGILYPSYLEEIGSDETLLESFEEHGLIEICLHGLLSVSVADEIFDAKLAVLRDLFRHHVLQEEEEVFPELERSLAEGRAQELGREMSARFAECVENGWEEILAGAVADYVAAEVPAPGRGAHNEIRVPVRGTRDRRS